MKATTVFRILLTIILAGLFGLPMAQVNSHSTIRPAGADQPPIYQGGEWSDRFVPCQLSDVLNVECNWYHLQLKMDEYLDWKQTWTAHFAGGEFFQTEAVSDSVRLAPNGAGQYFTTGSYTSTVFDAGKPVDWTFSQWNSNTFSQLRVEFRIGITPDPDSTWTGWASPRIGSDEFVCAILIGNPVQTHCFNIMGGIESSQYIQYRALFNSYDPTQTIELYDIALVYGTHPTSGTASSVLVSPVDLLSWDKVVFSSTVPAGTSLVVDVLAADGTVLLENAVDGENLAGIDPHQYPALRLRATLTTTDPSLTPDLDMWGLQWSVPLKIYLPVMMR